LIRRITPAATALMAAAWVAAPPEARAADTPGVSTQVFADIYLGLDANRPASSRRPPYLYNHTRAGSPELNLGLFRVSALGERGRGNLGLMIGTYARENLAHEPAWARHVFEANAGLSLDARHDVWLDAGVLPSHIGFESAISSQNPTLSRSLAAENSPYYLTGVRLAWDKDPRLKLAALAVTGWQRIRPAPGNSLPALGTQIVYSPTRMVTMNWSTYVGTEGPDGNRRMRYFSNLYAQVGVSQSTAVTLGLDIGAQQRAPGADTHDTWSASVAIIRFRVSERWATALRAEHYRDANNVVAVTANDLGARTSGLSWNIDWQLSQGVLARAEIRHLKDTNAIFRRGETGLVDESTSLLGSLSFEL
jgi:hypothetical protein